MKQGFRASTMLATLIAKRDTIHAALNQDVTELKANLAAVERLIDIYSARAMTINVEKLPKTLKAASTVRAAANGHGTRRHKGDLLLPVLQLMSKGPQPKDTMVTLINSLGVSGRGLGAFVASGYVTRAKTGPKTGIYTITPKGRQKLAALQPSKP